MPSFLSIFTAMAAVSKVPSHAAHAYLPSIIPDITVSPSPHPLSMTLDAIPQTINHLPNTTANFQSKFNQLSLLINAYNTSRTILFSAYTQFQNNETIARYNVRELCLNLLACILQAQKCGIYFEKIVNDQSLTKNQIAKLRKEFDIFKAQCAQDCISYELPPPQEVFYPNQVEPPANINDIVKILHLLQYVINADSKMISSVIGLYDPKVVIDYTGGGGLTFSNGEIHLDINTFEDPIDFFRMFSHENGHFKDDLYNHQSQITIPSIQLPYVIPELLQKQPNLKKDETQADITATIICSIYKVSLRRSYTDFKSEPPLPSSEEAQDPHPSGVERANIMQSAVSSLRYHFGNNHFGGHNIWQALAQKVRNISGVDFNDDMPTKADLFRIYELSPSDTEQQIRTLQAEYPHLFTNTTRGDYPNAPVVAADIDKQLGAVVNWSLPFNQDRFDILTQTIKDFQAKWKLANGSVPFPSSVTAAPAPKLFTYQHSKAKKDEQIEPEASSGQQTRRVATRHIHKAKGKKNRV